MDNTTEQKNSQAKTLHLGISYQIRQGKPNKPNNNEENLPKVISPADEERRQQQERTRLAKENFLYAYEESLCNITRSCKYANIGRTTFYDWLEDDPEFKKECEEVKKTLQDKFEDALKELAIMGKEKSIHFWLSRNHPNYIPKMENRLVDARTLEDLIDEEDEEEEIEQGTDRGVIQDSEQKAGAGAVQVEHSTAILAGSHDEEEHNPQSPSQGTD